MECVEYFFRLGGNIGSLNGRSDANSTFQEESLRQEHLVGKA
jgi:hypothetical protein